MSEICTRCNLPIENDQAAMHDHVMAPRHVMCPPPTDADEHGVYFGHNCVTPSYCRQIKLCIGTCKLF